ncbi:flavin reductase family protein [Streptomyces sp. NPDC020898]|uniref:flavin reductase family protein n=1 Tax=Streptomyces sp. NPDC020898 TaxID=3365101 RepID=UPI00378AF7CD
MFRSVMGHFCTGVTVVTGRGPDTPRGPGTPMGFTCQSFSSLSLQPPRVVLCVSRTSSSWPVIRSSGTFCINVLAQHQHGLSERFAHSGGDKFAGVEWSAAPSGSPRLAGASAWIDCSLHAELDGGDHLIVVGDVHRLGASPDAPAPLLYHRGRYTRTADVG